MVVEGHEDTGGALPARGSSPDARRTTTVQSTEDSVQGEGPVL
jgi:hypothetical protein